MKKIDLRNARKETTMFLSDAEIENKYEAQILSSISELKVQLSGLESISNFEDLLKSDKKLLSILLLSLEYLQKSLRE